MTNKTYNYRQIHPWRFMVILYENDTPINSFIDWNINWPYVELSLKEAGYTYKKRTVKLTPEDNYYEYFLHNFN